MEKSERSLIAYHRRQQERARNVKCRALPLLRCTCARHSAAMCRRWRSARGRSAAPTVPPCFLSAALLQAAYELQSAARLGHEGHASMLASMGCRHGCKQVAGSAGRLLLLSSSRWQQAAQSGEAASCRLAWMAAPASLVSPIRGTRAWRLHIWSALYLLLFVV